MNMDLFIANMPDNQCARCGNWYDDKEAKKHTCKEYSTYYGKPINKKMTKDDLLEIIKIAGKEISRLRKLQEDEKL